MIGQLRRSGVAESATGQSDRPAEDFLTNEAVEERGMGWLMEEEEERGRG